MKEGGDKGGKAGGGGAGQLHCLLFFANVDS